MKRNRAAEMVAISKFYLSERKERLGYTGTILCDMHRFSARPAGVLGDEYQPKDLIARTERSEFRALKRPRADILPRLKMFRKIPRSRTGNTLNSLRAKFWLKAVLAFTPL